VCVRYNSKRQRWERWIPSLGIVVEIAPPSWAPVQEELFPGRRGYFARATHDGYTMETGRFGLVPSWAKPLSGQWKNGFYNARAEGAEGRNNGIDNMPAFADAFKTRRAVVPIDSYYENADVGEAAAEKRYVEIFPVDEPGFLMAAMWNRPNQHCDEPSFSLVTTASHGELATIHSRRLAILDEESLEVWRDPDAPIDALKEILWPRGPEPLRIVEAERPTRAKKAVEEPPNLFS